jgi:thiosulfate/3-mercaptopyruvate sulfurtransferase
VSTDWLAENLDDPALVILHVGRARQMPEEFIPGARFIDYEDFVAREQNGLIVEIPPIHRIVEALRATGVSNDLRVVVYGSPGHYPARLFMTLDYLGHGDRTSVLDGGLEMWKAEGRPVASQSSAGPAGSFEANPNDTVLVDADWIHERLGDASVTLIDARPSDEYTGQTVGRDPRGGHIPGAYNLYWEDLLVSPDQPVLRTIEEVRVLFEDAGVREDGVVVSYCLIGMRASYTYLISKHLGLDARFYDGSWNQWSKREELPAVTGPERH